MATIKIQKTMTQAFALSEEDTDEDYELSDDKLEEAIINFSQDFESASEEDFDPSIDLSQDYHGLFESLDAKINQEERAQNIQWI
jgi:hypothetical protein